ncbi:MAG TPA: SDR family NAD(P)-dependent oxidoreductase [Candidatus Nanopelagicales bacterium]|nr:SDR family NAD(P)-dependent oxidoreductase [Candidatus Nanopelagicales bacterium]
MSNRVVVVTGCAGPAGRATVRRLLDQGEIVVGADASATGLAELAESLDEEQAGRFHGGIVDLLDHAATSAWAAQVLSEHHQVDGVVHLVGGWRGGKSFTDNDLADSDWLFALLVRTLQNVSLAFHDALAAGPVGRFVIISAMAATAPDPGSASYAAAKAAAEAWTFALAASFRKLAGDEALRPAATALVVKALLTDQMRAAKPDAKFAGFTHVDDLAEVVGGLWERDAEELNGRRLVLAP